MMMARYIGQRRERGNAVGKKERGLTVLTALCVWKWKVGSGERAQCVARAQLV